MEPPIIFDKPSEQQEKRREDILSALRSEPILDTLKLYLDGAHAGSDLRTTDTFTQRLREVADMLGVKRAEFYKPLQGPHHVCNFRKAWHQRYPHEHITVWDLDFKLQCPPSWSYETENGSLSLLYNGDRKCEGLDDVFRELSTIDCGMGAQLFIALALRSTIGNKDFEMLFESKFRLTQRWAMSFLRPPSSGEQSRIQVRTVFNHPTYILKHPGGHARLYNVIQVDNDIIFFDPDAPQNIISEADLEQLLLQNYNAPRNYADEETLWLWRENPEHIHPHFAPKDFGAMAKESDEYENHVLSETDWLNSKEDRKECELRFVLDFPDLMKDIEEIRKSREVEATLAELSSKIQSLEAKYALK